MNEIFNLIFSIFGQVIVWLKQIPVWENVSLFDFSVALIILTIVLCAFVPVVAIGGSNWGMQHEIYREPRKIGFNSENTDDKWHIRRGKK